MCVILIEYIYWVGRVRMEASSQSSITRARFLPGPPSRCVTGRSSAPNNREWPVPLCLSAIGASSRHYTCFHSLCAGGKSENLHFSSTCGNSPAQCTGTRRRSGIKCFNMTRVCVSGSLFWAEWLDPSLRRFSLTSTPLTPHTQGDQWRVAVLTWSRAGDGDY